MASQKNARPGPAAQSTEYPGLLGELPPVYPALFDPERPPPSVEWLAKVVGKLDSTESAKWWRQEVLTAKKELLAHEKRCMELLAEQFGIDLNSPDAWLRMTMALARRHVPAFQIQHAMEKARMRRAKKPIKLDHTGTFCLLVLSELEKVAKHRPLDEDETETLRIVQAQIAARRLSKRTIRQLKQEMREAMFFYWRREETDFQRQFVEEVWPLMERWQHSSLVSGEVTSTPAFNDQK